MLRRSSPPAGQTRDGGSVRAHRAQSSGDLRLCLRIFNWPIDQIQQVVQPDDQQLALLNDLTDAIAQASEIVKSQCPTNMAFAPVERLVQMEERLQGLLQAVNIVGPARAASHNRTR